MKRVLSVIIAVVLLTSMVGCSGVNVKIASDSSTSGTSASATGTANAGSTTAAPEKKEIVELEWVKLDNTVSQTDLDYFYNSPVYKYIVEQTGVKLTVRGADADQAAIYVASGDLGDIVTVRDQISITPMVEGGLLLPLNDLVENNAPNIVNIFPERWKMAKNQLSVNGKAYVVGIRAGSEGRPGKVDHSVFNVRWDLYEQLGYPKVTNEHELLQVLAKMKELYPQTADGLPVYGVSFYLGTTSLQRFVGRFWHTFGYQQGTSKIYAYDVNNEGRLQCISDTNHMYWRAARYYNEAYRMGLLDPDSLTQQPADYQQKVDNGQMLNVWWLNEGDTFVKNILKTDPESKIGFGTIPVEGTTLHSDNTWVGGWASCYLAIPNSCKNPERAVQFMNYTFSYEGARTLFSGIEGIHWTIVDGEPRWTDEVIGLIKAGGEKWKETGINSGIIGNLIGLGVAEINPADGGPLYLAKGEYYIKKGLLPVDKNYCEHYGVEYPMQVFSKLIDEGKVGTHSKLDLRVTNSMGSAPEDIALIDTTCLNLAIKAIPALVMAENDNEFASVQNKLLADLEAAGIAKSIKWWNDRYDTVRKSFGY